MCVMWLFVVTHNKLEETTTRGSLFNGYLGGFEKGQGHESGILHCPSFCISLPVAKLEQRTGPTQ